MPDTGRNPLPGRARRIRIRLSPRVASRSAVGASAALALAAAVSVAARPAPPDGGKRPYVPRAVRPLGQDSPAKGKSGGRNEPTGWTMVSDTMEYMDATGDNRFTDVVATSDQDTVVHADLWVGNDKTHQARATGNLRMTDPQADVTALQADVNYAKGKRLLVLTGDVVMFIKPKKAEPAAPQPASVPVSGGETSGVHPAISSQADAASKPSGPPAGSSQQTDSAASQDDEQSAGSARKYPVTVTCDRVDYEYARTKKHALLTGHFRAVQKLPDNVRTLTAEHAEWFGLEDRLVLYPPVHGEDTKGIQSFDTKEPVTVITTEGAEKITVKHGTVIYRWQDEEEQPAGPGANGETATPAKAGDKKKP